MFLFQPFYASTVLCIKVKQIQKIKWLQKCVCLGKLINVKNRNELGGEFDSRVKLLTQCWHWMFALNYNDKGFKMNSVSRWMVLKYTNVKHTQHYIHIYIYSRICKIQHIYFSCSKYTFPWLQYVIVKANFMLYCCFGLADVTKPFESGVIFPECPLSTMDINFIYKTCINTFLLLMSFFFFSVKLYFMKVHLLV